MNDSPCLCPSSEAKIEEIEITAHHNLPVVDATDRDESVTVKLFVILRCVTENGQVHA